METTDDDENDHMMTNTATTTTTTATATLPNQSIPYHTKPYHTIPYHTIPYHNIPYHTIPYHTIPCHTISTPCIPYRTIPYHPLLVMVLVWALLQYNTYRQLFFIVEQYVALSNALCSASPGIPTIPRIFLLIPHATNSTISTVVSRVHVQMQISEAFFSLEGLYVTQEHWLLTLSFRSAVPF